MLPSFLGVVPTMPRRAASVYLLYSKASSWRYVLGPAIISIDDAGRIGGGAVARWRGGAVARWSATSASSELARTGCGLPFRRPGREPRRGYAFPA